MTPCWRIMRASAMGSSLFASSIPTRVFPAAVSSAALLNRGTRVASMFLPYRITSMARAVGFRMPPAISAPILTPVSPGRIVSAAAAAPALLIAGEISAMPNVMGRVRAVSTTRFRNLPTMESPALYPVAASP